MRFNRKALTAAMLTIFAVASAAAQDISLEEANKAAAEAKVEQDTLPDDAIIVRRVPLASGPDLNITELVVDTIPSSSEGL